MLTLTPNAATTIRSLIEHSEVPQGGGLRIANNPTESALTLSLAAEPAQDDRVVDDAGARLFLDPQAAVILDDKTLDAAPDPDGRVQFGIAARP